MAVVMRQSPKTEVTSVRLSDCIVPRSEVKVQDFMFFPIIKSRDKAVEKEMRRSFVWVLFPKDMKVTEGWNLINSDNKTLTPIEFDSGRGLYEQVHFKGRAISDIRQGRPVALDVGYYFFDCYGLRVNGADDQNGWIAWGSGSARVALPRDVVVQADKFNAAKAAFRLEERALNLEFGSLAGALEALFRE